MPEPSRRSYPLGALFVLIAVCGILAALAAPLARAVESGKVSGLDVVLAMLAGAVFTSLLGAAVGVLHHRWVVGGVLGMGIGTLIGLACGPLMLIPASGFAGLLVASIGGSIVMIGVGSALRWGSGN